MELPLWPEPWTHPYMMTVTPTDIPSTPSLPSPLLRQPQTQTKTPFKKFACNDCDARFNRINDLKRHQLRHRKEASHDEVIQCTECPMQFTRCYSFRRHCHRKHSFLLNTAKIMPMKSAMTELQRQIWNWCQEINTTIDPAVLMNTKKRRQSSSSLSSASSSRGTPT